MFTLLKCKMMEKCKGIVSSCEAKLWQCFVTAEGHFVCNIKPQKTTTDR